MCNNTNETDTLHVLLYSHQLVSQFKHEMISTLQLKLLSLLDGDMFLLCFLEWMLDDEYDNIKGVLDRVMMSLQQVDRHNVWHGFLSTSFQ